MKKLTHAEVCELLIYEPETGIFRWRKSMGKTAKAGTRAGTEWLNGYREIWINDKRHREHMLAFFIMTGRWVPRKIRHRNGRRSDNRWRNLFEAVPPPTTPAKQTKWTPERIEHVRQLAALDLEAAEIAAKCDFLGHCRDGGRVAVISAANRYGIRIQPGIYNRARSARKSHAHSVQVVRHQGVAAPEPEGRRGERVVVITLARTTMERSRD